MRFAGEYILGPTAMGSGVIDGFFFDDKWTPCSASGNCSGPAAGPAEMPDNATAAMGLSVQDVADLAGNFTVSQVSCFLE
jgi:hypothetical protein